MSFSLQVIDGEFFEFSAVDEVLVVHAWAEYILPSSHVGVVVSYLILELREREGFGDVELERFILDECLRAILQAEYTRQADLFEVAEVQVTVPAADMPGPTRFKAQCARCGIIVRDKKEVLKNNEILCRPCAFGSYFSPIKGNINEKKQRSL